MSPLDKIHEGNAYIKKQFQNLAKLKVKKDHKKFWEVSFNLLQHSHIFFLVSLYKWNPTFYKEMKMRSLFKLIKDFRSCVLTKKD